MAVQVELTATTGRGTALTAGGGHEHPLTVTTGRVPLPVIRATRYTGVVMATTVGVDLAFLTEGGNYLLLESGDILLTA